jgi:sugar phosphate permease
MHWTVSQFLPNEVESCLLCVNFKGSNAGNVRIYTFLPDTNMTAAQFNTGLTIYSCFYGGLEVPAQLVLQKFGPRRFLSTIVTCWGIVTVCHMAIKNHQHFWALRALLGVFEAGIYQGCFYTLTRWFLPRELQKRTGAWYTATMVSGAFGGL